MSISTTQPVPKDLREQMLQRISAMPEDEVVDLYELLLLTEKIRAYRASRKPA